MTENQIIVAFNKFKHKSPYKACKELASGHINDTYLIETESKPYYVLQRINHGVFNDISGLITNKVKVSKHIKNKLKHLSKSERNKRVLRFVKTINGKGFYKDTQGNYWNMMLYIEDSITHETVTNKEIAYQAGKLFGEFLNLTSDFNVKKLSEVIPRFHDMSFRFQQFDNAVLKATENRLSQAKLWIDFAKEHKSEMHILQQFKESGQIGLRVTHNDTKISNALFDKNNKSLCVIDTDTVMPGIIHYDFGDAIRTICNTAAEDEVDSSKIKFNIEFYKAYVKGFLLENKFTKLEKRYLPLGAKTIIFIMGLRFLTDYLNNDIYYKTKYLNQNLDRAINQFTLLKRFTDVEPEIQQFHHKLTVSYSKDALN